MAVAVEQWLILPSLGTKLCVSFANDRLGCETQVERKVLEMAQHASFHQHVSYNLSTILHAFTAGEVGVRLLTGLVSALSEGIHQQERGRDTIRLFALGKLSTSPMYYSCSLHLG